MQEGTRYIQKGSFEDEKVVIDLEIIPSSC
jgi:hypothetical protein